MDVLPGAVTLSKIICLSYEKESTAPYFPQYNLHKMVVNKLHWPVNPCLKIYYFKLNVYVVESEVLSTLNRKNLLPVLPPETWEQILSRRSWCAEEQLGSKNSCVPYK